MKTTSTIILISLLIIFSLPNAMAQGEAREIVRRMEENMRGDASYQEMTMQTVRPRYTREISMKAWSMGSDYALIYVTAPARDQGTAFLKRGKEMWNYVPAIDRTVKMPPSMMSQSWMGSDFTNDDLVEGLSAVDDFTHKLLRSETVNGDDCFVVELIPKPETPVVYDRVVYRITKQHYLPLLVENFDDLGDLVNTMHFREIQEMGGRTIPTVWEMIPHDKQGQKTLLTIEKADFTIRPEQQFFSLQNLTRVR